MNYESTWIDWIGAGCVLFILIIFLIARVEEARASYEEDDQ